MSSRVFLILSAGRCTDRHLRSCCIGNALIGPKKRFPISVAGNTIALQKQLDIFVGAEENINTHDGQGSNRFELAFCAL